MKIAVDCGAFCTDKNNRFGNYIFSENLVCAIQQYDRKNSYNFYSFCEKPKFIKRSSRFIYKNLRPKPFWSTIRTGVEGIIDKNNIFLALNQSIPFMTSSKVISFCHGLSYYFHPEFYPDSYSRLKNQLNRMVKYSYRIVVSSEKIKQELSLVFPNINPKITVIPFGVPFDMVGSKQEVGSKKMKVGKKFFLFVGMNHPVKNIDFIVERFKEFKRLGIGKGYKLVLVSNVVKNRWNENVIIIKNISRIRLKKFYQKATGLLTSSLYESFNLPVLEALSQGCPVVGLKSAIIPELSSYINLCKNEEEFSLAMKNAAVNNLKYVNVKDIIQKFTWKNYVVKLLKLFHPTGGN